MSTEVELAKSRRGYKCQGCTKKLVIQEAIVVLQPFLQQLSLLGSSCPRKRRVAMCQSQILCDNNNDGFSQTPRCLYKRHDFTTIFIDFSHFLNNSPMGYCQACYIIGNVQNMSFKNSYLTYRDTLVPAQDSGGNHVETLGDTYSTSFLIVNVPLLFNIKHSQTNIATIVKSQSMDGHAIVHLTHPQPATYVRGPDKYCASSHCIFYCDKIHVNTRAVRLFTNRGCRLSACDFPFAFV